ncbi:hypothetical protein [Rubinisphaera brasiliensis]|uniref:Integrase/recombinase protein n=1 Tax=Rubinisphaera brasiliensis (strain ATCC 49424 / DSM 5305 / JCM 21570 / IAM 15109 / NBRC 103401 / IFAM 1448) TaxID=756272 RepID=F0SNJ7_RUBBR|nr:hypothetical protein [Rubinisphaera brasiliensis]ADY57831.1 integrase/recombinase protein [Rubinisphaera brasiliensis DSM 5305]
MKIEDYRKWLEERWAEQEELAKESYSEGDIGATCNRTGKANAYRIALEKLDEVTE